MTTLEAVNRILMAAGTLPVSALDTGGASFAANAERILNEEELRIQSRGWHYNTRVNVQLTPDGITSKIALPASVITIDSDRWSMSTDVTTFGQFLFDRERNVDTFDGPLLVTYTLRLGFDCIPHPIAAYIADCAAVIFNEDYGDRRRQLRLEQRERKSHAAANRFEGDSSDTNILDTADARRTLGGRRGGGLMF